jgi:predicted RNA-binding Zn-ribbon protein involved in translation (DUF1610 family)
MVDFKKMLEDHKVKGKFIGYCENCDTDSKIYECDILPAYKDAPKKEQKVKCPKCGMYQLANELIPF